MNYTKIEWCDYSWNPVTGCTKISEGCRNCYAERMARRFVGDFAVETHEDRLTQPLGWRKPGRVFVCSAGDLFHEEVPDRFIARVWNTMACATLSCRKRHEHSEECWGGQQHTFIVLTKRPERAVRFLNEGIYREAEELHPEDALSVAMDVGLPLRNVWVGVSVENQEQAQLRIPWLLHIPAAAVRFVSVEPMLEAVDIGVFLAFLGEGYQDFGVNWVICGPETGPRKRPFYERWAVALHEQCLRAHVPFFYKPAPMLCGEPAREWPR